MPGLTLTFPDCAAKLLPDSGHDSSKNPHDLPEFDSVPSTPVLFLTPLLPSLPATYPAPQKPSCYAPLVHETRLPDIDPSSLSLHRALHRFRPLDDQYASRPYSEAFNWDELILPEEDEREWYCVAFRSVRKENIDSDPLYSADRLAHEEAIRNGGLIMYWYGVPSPDTRENLATCIWQSRQHAIAANSSPEHIKAARLAKATYDVYELERWVVRKIKGETGIHLEKYTEGPVGW